MKKLFPFGLVMIMLICLPTIAEAQDNSKYLAGAVPEVDGKVVFQREFSIPGATEDQVFDRVSSWLENRMKENENQSRIVFAKRETGEVAAMGEEYIVFTATMLSLDRTLMNYQITVDCEPAKCAIEVGRIRYSYGEEKFSAEEWISDAQALNKNKTKLVRGTSKFRIKTIDFVEELFNSAQVGLAAVPATAVVQQPVIWAAPAPEEVVASKPTAATTLEGYKQIAPDKIPGNIIKMLEQDWMLITAGTDQSFNMMTASWGGLGRLYEKPVALCFINPTRHTYQLMEKNDTYTLTFYTEAYRDALNYCGTNSGKNTDKVKGSGLTPITTPSGSKAFGEAWLIIECKKLVSQSLSHDAIANEALKEEWVGKQLHKMYIGEIINVWMK